MRDLGIRKKLHEIFEKEAPGPEVALLLSGGLDSAVLLLALLDLKKQVTCYTFHVRKHESTDLKLARQLAQYFNLEHVVFPLRMDPDYLIRRISYLRFALNFTKKTEIEGGFPMIEIAPIVKEPFVVSGYYMDAHYLPTRYASQNFRGNEDAYRDQILNLFAKKTIKRGDGGDDEVWGIRETYKSLGKHYIDPGTRPDFIECFRGTNAAELNENGMKGYYYQEFPELNDMPKRKIMQSQKGDSQIADNFEKLLLTRYNTQNSKSVIGIYNSL